MGEPVNADLLREVEAAGRWYYRSLDPAEWESYRRLVRKAGGRLVAVDAGGKVASLTTARLRLGRNAPNAPYPYGGPVARYILAELLKRWGPHALVCPEAGMPMSENDTRRTPLGPDARRILPMSELSPLLTTKQAQAILALLTEPTRAAAAARCGISTKSLYRWFRCPHFRKAYDLARERHLEAEAVELARRRAERLAGARP